MTPVAWAVQMPDGRIDHELVGTQREVEWWCGTDEGRAAGRQPVALFLAPALAPNAGRMHSCDDPLCAVCGNPWAPPVECAA